MEPTHIIGTAFMGADFQQENVELVIQDGIIADILPARKKTDLIILPAFFNAHTHVGDTVAMDTAIDRPLAELVAPPNGLKHKILRETSNDKLVSAMQHSLYFMRNSGTLGFADFREGGEMGVNSLISAKVSGITPMIFGRDGGELSSSAAGFGLSSAHGSDTEREAVKRARKAKKLIAVHAGEGRVKDIKPAFELKPDLIIHATNFSSEDIKRAADENIKIVICPRSNWLLGATDSAKKPCVREMLESGCEVFLGTDNCMFVPPDMMAECAFLMTIYKISAKEALQMATSGFSLMGNRGIIEKGTPANLVIMDGKGHSSWSKDLLRTAICRLGSGAIAQVIYPEHDCDFK